MSGSVSKHSVINLFSSYLAQRSDENWQKHGGRNIAGLTQGKESARSLNARDWRPQCFCPHFSAQFRFVTARQCGGTVHPFDRHKFMPLCLVEPECSRKESQKLKRRMSRERRLRSCLQNSPMLCLHPAGERETKLGRRCPRRHGPLARIRLGRLGRAWFPAHVASVYFEDSSWARGRSTFAGPAIFAPFYGQNSE